MKREIGFDQIRKDPSSVITVGTFDGVHRGHQSIIHYLVARARAQQGSSVVVTFDPHPREVVQGEEVPLLTTLEERARYLEALRLDRLIVIPFTKEFGGTPPDVFVVDYLVKRIGMREIVIGYDHAFGRGRSGNRETLESLGKEHDFTVDVLPPQAHSQTVISSTVVRRLLTVSGDAAGAAEMLGRPYELEGEIVGGAGRGKLIGFPTANIRVNHPRKVIPANGVYAVQVTFPAGPETAATGGMMNIGVRPTFENDMNRRELEVHLFDFDRDAYGETLRVQFLQRVRDEVTFSSVDALVEQLQRDKERCMRLVKVVS